MVLGAWVVEVIDSVDGGHTGSESCKGLGSGRASNARPITKAAFKQVLAAIGSLNGSLLLVSGRDGVVDLRPPGNVVLTGDILGPTE